MGLADAADDPNSLPAQVVHIEKLGEASLLYLEIAPGAPTITLKLDGTTRIRSGENIRVHVPAQDLHLFDAVGDALQRTVDLPV